MPPEIGPTDDELVERIVDSRVLHRGRYLTFRVDTIERADGSRSERDIAGHPGAVAIVAIDDADRVVLVRQWRTPVGGILLELPAGGLDADEDAGTTEDPALAARRELEEETGFRATTWRRITSFWSAPGFTSELMHLFVATGLEPAHPDERLGPDEDEHLRVVRMPFDDAVAAVERGEIVDAKSIVGLLWVARERAAARESVASGDVAAATRRPSQATIPPLDQSAFAPDDVTVDVSWRPTMNEVLLAAAAHARRSPGGRVFSTIVLIAAVYWLLTIDIAGAIPPLIVAVAGLTGFLVVPFAWWTVSRNREMFLGEIRITVGPSGIAYRSTTMESTTPWTAITRIAESGRFLFVELGPQVVFVALRVLSDADLHEIRRLAAEAGFAPGGRRSDARAHS